MQKSDQLLLSDIAFALTDHETTQYGAAHFVDLTTGEVTFIPRDVRIDEDMTEEEIKAFPDWEQELIRTYLEHDLIEISPIYSSVSFRVMEAFAETRTNKRELQRLGCALTKRKPFANFRSAVDDLGILQEWYDFKNAAEIKQAQEWLEENELEIKDGKIKRIEKFITIDPAFDPLFSKKYLITTVAEKGEKLKYKRKKH